MLKHNLLINQKCKLKYKKARALQTKTAKKMAKVYEAFEVVDDKGEPAPDMETVIEILTAKKQSRAILKVMIVLLCGIHGVMYIFQMENMKKLSMLMKM